jgi:tripartite-type tricarboxylate transporter receptor subunit TctC
MRKPFVAAVLAACLGWTAAATAQNYPNRPITLVIPFAAGGPTDVLGRAMGQKLGEILGQTVVIENVGGAGGMLGGARVAKAEPDGYTMVLGTVGTHAQNQTLYKKPHYHAANDFTPVVLMAELPIVLIARKDFPADNLKEFAAYAKQNQDKMQFGSAGAGSATHLGCVVVNQALGTNSMAHVPYPGTGPAMTDLIGGRVDFLCDIITTAKPQVDGGTVKAIATLAKVRSPALADVPTAAEQGVSDMEAYTWNAFFLPKGAPADVVKKLHAATVEAMKDPNVRGKLEKLGATFVSPDRTTPEYLGKFVLSEIEKWAKPIRASGVSAD